MIFLPASATERASRRFLPELQGLRALAVALVVLFHLWPLRVPGGYVGVDVFFVISGYLITSHLRREIEDTGTIGLASFYARRMRRLLPASLLVLVVAGVAAALIQTPQLARSTGREVLASAFYVENLWLASRAVTYSASNDIASPVQHYWSLSAEEQFYALWPTLIILGAWLGRRFFRGRTVWTIGAVLTGLALISFTHSVALTASSQSLAYFITTTRVWEFAAGAMVAFLLTRVVPTPGFALALRWVGLVTIVTTSFVISQATPFPGWVALFPVVATAAVIVAGDTGTRDPLSWLISTRPVQWLGDVSYSVYLWHWPLIALVPLVVGRALAAPDKLAIMVATGLLATLSRTYVEQPFLSKRIAGSRPRRTFAVVALATAVIAATTLGHGAWLDQLSSAEAEARSRQLTSDPCLGAAAILDPATCGNAFGTRPLAPVSEADTPWITTSCDPVCGERGQDTKMLALVGDSHAQTLYNAVEPIARREGWVLSLIVLGACPLNLNGSDVYLGGPRPSDYCGRWSERTVVQLEQLRPDLVVSLSHSAATWSDPATGRDGFERTWSRIERVAPVVVVRDYPGTNGVWGPECLALNAARPNACDVPRSKALSPDLAFETAVASRRPTLDLTDAFCNETTCHAVVGRLPVYFDKDHITGTFARSLAPVVDDRLTLR